MFLTIPWWSALLIYALCFIVISFVFQAIDWGKFLREEYRNLNLGIALYLIATLCATSMIGTLIIMITGFLMQI